MMLILLIVCSAVLGAVIGLFCGLIPAFHQNNLAIILVLFFPFYAGLTGNFADAMLGFVALFMSAICTHSFSDIVGAMITGIPDASEVLTLQPAQRLLAKGEGMRAIEASVLGSFVGILIGLALLLPAKLLLADPINLYHTLKPFIPVVLVAVSALVILSEKGVKRKRGRKFVVLDIGKGSDGYALELNGKIVKISENGRKGVLETGNRRIEFESRQNMENYLNREVTLTGIFVDNYMEIRTTRYLQALFVFLVAGCLGWIVLFTPLASTTTFTLLFPLFTGLFGVSGLLLNLTKPGKVPKQHEIAEPGSLRAERKVLGGAIVGTLIGIFPGITPGCGAVLIPSKNTKPEQYIALTSAIETSAFVFNIAALFIIQKTRSGAIATLNQMYPFTAGENGFFSPLLFLALFGACTGALCALLLLPSLGRFVLAHAGIFMSRKIQIGILCGMLLSVFAVTGLTGMAVLGVATLVGLVPVMLELRRIHLMGSILLPVTLALL